MSVTEEARPPGAPSPEPRYDQAFDRTPPQDIAAEQSVLGAMLLSKDAISDVVEILRSADFYRPAHTAIFDTIVDMYGRGEPADAITVANSLNAADALQRIGGLPYLYTLISSVPTAANAGYYARIVGERAVLRRLVEAGTRIVQMGYGAAAGQGREVDDVVDLAQQAVYDVTERRVSEDFAVLGELLQPTLDEIEASGARDGVMSGVPTGFGDLDRLLNGLHPGQLIIVAGRPGLGKALSLDTPLPTPEGWTTMGEVRIGDRLLDGKGRPTLVTALSEIMVGRSCYEVEFSDGSVIVADGAHRWVTHARGEVGASVRTTDEIRASLRRRDGRANHAVALTRPLTLPDQDLPVAPYTLGVWLGAGREGTARFDTADPEVVAFVEADGYAVGMDSPGSYVVESMPWQPRQDRICGVCGARGTRRRGPAPDRVCVLCGVVVYGPATTPRPATAARRRALGLVALLRRGGVLRHKHVPGPYLRASAQQRRDLLTGILDAAGEVTRSGTVRLATPSRRFAADLRELAVSLGYRCSADRRHPKTVVITAADSDLFRLERKRLAHKERARTRDAVRAQQRSIVDVRRIPSVPVRCVSVANPGHIYLAGPSMIPTHNSTAAMDFARSASVRNGLASAIFSLEMSKIEIVMRLLAAEAKVPMHVLRSGQLSDDDWTRLARRMGEISEAPVFVDDTPNMNLMEIRAKARRLRQRNELRLVIVDYLQLMTSPKRVENRQQEVAELSRGLKLLAKEIECPVVAVSQLNRGPEQRTDKRPQLSDLRESGCLVASTRLLRADNNQEVTLGELVATGATDVPIWAFDEKLRCVPRTLTHGFPSGTRPVFRMRLASGREVEATGSHRFLTVEGWTPLEQLTRGDRIAAPRHIPAPLEPTEWPDDRVILLAHLLGDGSFVKRQPMRYASVDEANLTTVAAAAASAFGIKAIRDEYAAARVTTLRLPAPYRLARGRRNPIAEWLDGLRLFGLRSHEKFIPSAVLGLGKRQVALFLRHLWATDGSVTVNRSGGGGRVYFGSTSRELLNGIAMLLLRFGITGRIRTVPVVGHRAQYTLDISGCDDQLRFVREVGAYGERGKACDALLTALADVKSNTNVDTVPREIWSTVREILSDKGMSHREFSAAIGTQFCGSTLWKRAPSRARLARVAAVLDSAELDLYATNDVFWDEIVAIEPTGTQDVYDATVLGLHNFVANGVIAHNSIEQDADVVILLHRDDYYDKESPRAGEADFIVAKHRNGPTDTVTVAAQLHFSRFVDMAVG